MQDLLKETEMLQLLCNGLKEKKVLDGIMIIIVLKLILYKFTRAKKNINIFFFIFYRQERSSSSISQSTGHQVKEGERWCWQSLQRNQISRWQQNLDWNMLFLKLMTHHLKKTWMFQKIMFTFLLKVTPPPKKSHIWLQ